MLDTFLSGELAVEMDRLLVISGGMRHHRHSFPFFPTHGECLHVVAGLLPYPGPGGHSYRAAKGTFSWSSDKRINLICTGGCFCYVDALIGSNVNAVNGN